MHSFVHGRRLEVIPSKRANGTVVEVEVHDVLSKITAAVDCTHVVVELDGTNVLEGSSGK